jgi:probable HAF family extracellular repeat protein
MSRFLRSTLTMLGLVAAVGACADDPMAPVSSAKTAPVDAQPAPRYVVAPSGTIVDLGTLAGYPYGTAYAVNASGAVAGWSNTATVTHAMFRSASGSLTDLGTLGGTNSFAFALNDNNVVVGHAQVANGEYHAFRWTQAGGMVDLNTRGTIGGTRASAYDINGSGDIVGLAYDAAGHYKAVLWPASGGVTDLGTMNQGTSGAAYGINDAGVVVGLATDASGKDRAFRWTAAGGMTDLGTLGGPSARARGINAAGDIVGWSEVSAGVQHAFIRYASGSMTDLGTFGGPAFAHRLNDQQQVVGWNLPSSGVNQGEYWTQATGMRDLGTLDTEVLSRATGINNNGRVVGRSNDRPVMWFLTSNAVPVASLANVSAATTRFEGASYVFDGTASSDADGDLLTYAWTFGDATASQTGATPSHSYAQNGTYTVSLTVTDWRGATSTTVTKSVTVTNAAPVVAQVANGTTVGPGNALYTFTVSFTDAGAQDSPWTVTVNWGDGTSASTYNRTDQTSFTASHNYPANVKRTTVTVTTTVRDKDNATGTMTHTVAVQ